MNRDDTQSDLAYEAGMLLVGSLFGALALCATGSFLGAFFLPSPERLGAWLGLPGILPEGWWAYSVAGLVLGALGGFVASWRQLRRRRELRDAALALGLEFSDKGPDELTAGLEQLIGQNKSFALSNVLLKDVAGARFYVADLKISTHSADSDSETFQTIAYVEAGDLSFPEFTLQPQGRLIKAFSHLIGTGNIHFEGYPEFSEQYLVLGSDTEAIRRLFTHSVLAHFSAHAGWQIQARENRLLVFRPGSSCSPAKLSDFMNDALAHFSLLFDAMPSHREAPNTTSVSATPRPTSASAPLPGALGRMLGMRIVSQAQVDDFLAQPTPRTAPSPIKQQTGYGLWFVLIWGILFGAIGGAVMTAMILTGQWMPALFCGLFPLIGFMVVLAATTRHVRRMRLLRYGQVVDARIESLEATQIWVNGQRRYLAVIKFPAPGGDLRRTISLYGPAARKAEVQLAQQLPLRVLYLPDRPHRFILADSLVTEF